MARKPTQTVMDVFKQKKVPTIEKWADVFNEKRDLIAGLKAEQKNAKLKLMEAIHRNASLLDKQETPTGEQKLMYVCGDYRVVLKIKEDIAVKIAEESKEGASEPTPDPEENDEPDPDIDVEVKK